MSANSVFLKDVIRQRRLYLGLSLADLASAVGIRSVDYLAMIEAGLHCVSPNRAVGFAAALELDQMDFCQLVLFELHPELYAAMFGPECPSSPRS
jgi:transcriptional regulator with XRE-family HTH domain